MFEAWGAASMAGKAANLWILLIVFLSWVSTMVTFGSVMHRLSTGDGSAIGTVHADFYWDHLHLSQSGVPDENYSYSDSALNQFGISSCKGGGDGTIAFAVGTPPTVLLAAVLRPLRLRVLTACDVSLLCVGSCCQVFAFLAFLIHLPLLLARIIGFNNPLARDTQHSLYIELVLTAIEWFCFFLTTCIWGGACYSPTRSIGSGSVSGVGFGLMIACFFFLTINLVLYFLMRSNENLVLGNGAGRSGGGGSGGYESGGGGGGEYSSGDSGQPTFSYQANSSDSGQL